MHFSVCIMLQTAVVLINSRFPVNARKCNRLNHLGPERRDDSVTTQFQPRLFFFFHFPKNLRHDSENCSLCDCICQAFTRRQLIALTQMIFCPFLWAIVSNWEFVTGQFVNLLRAGAFNMCLVRGGKDFLLINLDVFVCFLTFQNNDRY